MPPDLVGYPFGDLAAFGGWAWDKILISNGYAFQRKSISDASFFNNIQGCRISWKVGVPGSINRQN
jgi:hypothetical protein